MKGYRYLSIYTNRIWEPTIFVVIMCLILGSACTAGDDTRSSKENTGGVEIIPHKGDISVGKRIYDKYCYYCHGVEGKGDGAIAIGLTPRPVDFVNDVERMKKSDKVLFESISKGIHRKNDKSELAMPQWNLVLKEDEIWGVLTYVRYLSEKGRRKELNAH